VNQILKQGQVVHTESSNLNCYVESFLGGGGQGEVYKASLGGKPVALKWYFPHYLKYDQRLRERLERAINLGAPSDRFLWPREMASAEGVQAFGYVMELREDRFKGIVDLMTQRVDPSFRALATAGFELAHNYLQLHAKGFCYRDIAFGNVFFDPLTGHIRICDNDNVDVDGKPGPISGTPRFMAPEVVRGDALPSTQTDWYSLAVLMFYMLMVHHPLEGKKELAIHALDLPAMRKLYGTEALFIFDPKDRSNEPVPGYHDNALVFWPIYPKFLRDYFTRAFTDGIRDPQNGRVKEGEWRAIMIRLRDSIIYCSNAHENFYDPDALKSSGPKGQTCWSCGTEIRLPFRIRIDNSVGKSVIMLNHDTQLFPHHIDDHRRFDFTKPVASVAQHPNSPGIWGLKNLSNEKWVSVAADGSPKDVEPGRSVTLTSGTKILFGKSQGEIRI
jgi:serine/threonine protein kinase